MNRRIATGKKRTILISISILLVSLHTIYFYHSVRAEIETDKLAQQIVRFALTVALLVLVYRGKNWARIVSLILFSLGIIGAFIGIIAINSALLLKMPFIVMLIVYSMAVYHFGFSKSFKAYSDYRNGKFTFWE